ncbi:hypothetical protein OS493_010186 [Desmophyllum pertusum]|uniref:WWE domain-containing protein n=1 Tax=Desmophyllum pertusum TaxID=174260 RepID=A0A9X0CG74_9CNID|nr:hypothetical protein OS493_010186 [Desmophyllum pertusum]
MFITISRIHPSVSDFLLGKCKKGSKCSGHHCSLPFHWQYKVPDVGKWKSFSENDNEKLEKLYCDETLEECTATGFQISLKGIDIPASRPRGYDVNFLLDNKLMIVQKDFEVIAQIRRLSTESHVTNPGNTVATAWTWYWKDENGTWRQYDCRPIGEVKTGFISGIAPWVSKIYVVGA